MFMNLICLYDASLDVCSYPCEEVFKKYIQVHLIILKHTPTLPHPSISLHVTTPAGFSQYLVFIVVSECSKMNFY